MEMNFNLTNGERITPCILREPDFGRPRRVVIGVHGIGGCKEDGIQASIAEEMELFSCAVLRFDLPAHGENAEEILSLSGSVDTLLDVADYAAERYPDLKDLCIFATGFGAYVTLTALRDLIELPFRVKLVIQTPSLRMDQTVLGMTKVSPVTLEAMDMVIFKASRRPIGIFHSFYEECRDNPAFASYPIPMLILHGQEDSFIPMGDIQHFRQINNDSQLVIIPGTSHRFQETGAWDMVLDLVRDWFEFQQVLLLDSE